MFRAICESETNKNKQERDSKMRINLIAERKQAGYHSMIPACFGSSSLTGDTGITLN